MPEFEPQLGDMLEFSMFPKWKPRFFLIQKYNGIYRGEFSFVALELRTLTLKTLFIPQKPEDNEDLILPKRNASRETSENYYVLREGKCVFVAGK